VLISPRLARRVDWVKAEVTIDVDRETVKNSPDYHDQTMIDRSYEQTLHHYYSAARPHDRH
jgi:stress response protein YsnF